MEKIFWQEADQLKFALRHVVTALQAQWWRMHSETYVRRRACQLQSHGSGKYHKCYHVMLCRLIGLSRVSPEAGYTPYCSLQSPCGWRRKSFLPNALMELTVDEVVNKQQRRYAVVSPGFSARREKDGNYVMGHSRWTSGLGAAAARWLIVLRLMQYWSKKLCVVDICIS